MNKVRKFFQAMTRREKRFAAAGIVVALVVCVPVMAVAEPGLVHGSAPGEPVDPGVEQALAVERGDSCRDMLPDDTPTFVVCRWLSAPQDAADVASFWMTDDGARLEQAQPLPPRYVRCNQPTDLSKTTACKGGQTNCAQQPDGWYKCRNMATGTITFERTVNGERQIRTTAPTASTGPSSSVTPRARPTKMSSTSSPPATLTIAPSAIAPPASDTSPGQPSTRPDQSQAPRPDQQPTTATTPSATPTSSGAAPPSDQAGDPVAAAITAARTARLRIWIESDLADDFKAGQAQFRAALRTLINAASRPGVIGIKFADNLGYTSFTSEDEIKDFLRQASGALRAALPGKRLAIGVVVPELGCGAAAGCVAAMRAKAPLATKKLVERYIKTSAVEQVYVSNGLFASAYRQHQLRDPKTGKQQPVTPAVATRAQWLSIKALGWDTLAQISSREYGLAHSGPAAPWDDAQATAQINAYIGTVIGVGAPTVTLWGHNAVDGGRTYRLLDADLAMNPMWSQLIRQQLRERLSVVFDPRSTELGIHQDIAALGKAASEIFIVV
ncbi:hypothetical protein [Nonomuraea cavernae]|uniref:Uncharacterized protein n=1 Tax=Nonomuraea cavernae TaxID=2045107 RepID=A0A917ZDI6_9ACTN|nr:hypothetical protein [Nonomuraea cavernae]MCA2190614.1 hypothetical protein [Nonomuraea cavernae]GGO81350.1 hypothetical protein GCM10012289_70120 [Nonomuraea cavernae]